MAAGSLLEAVNDADLVSEKESAKFYVGIGTGGPAITAGAMLLLYEIAMALFIGLGPMFILSLLFDFTKGLFQKWFFYGIGTMFSMAMLSFVVSLALDMVTRVAAAMWTAAAAGQFLLGVNVNEGMSSQALQQGGMGIILTALIVSAPPMAALFFNGVMGHFSAYATMGAHLVPGGQPQMGAYSGGGPGGGYGGGISRRCRGRPIHAMKQVESELEISKLHRRLRTPRLRAGRQRTPPRRKVAWAPARAVRATRSRTCQPIRQPRRAVRTRAAAKLTIRLKILVHAAQSMPRRRVVRNRRRQGRRLLRSRRREPLQRACPRGWRVHPPYAGPAAERSDPPRRKLMEVENMKALTMLLAGLLVFGASASAQEVVNSPDYHARHNASSVYYQGPGQQQAQQPMPPQPTGYWEKTWGAIAPSPVGGVVGAAVGSSSKEEAERLALEDCRAKGGRACKIQIAYHNQCGVMVIGANELFTASAGSIEDAKDTGIKYCQKHDTNCRIYYSACTEPIFHKY